ncbi:hypothetical protein PC119_g15749 [Phytophthora cactorum]|uniref:Uncharacterized protein n=1 Tax=Phytophthora cactorum TaxID=29920 RepID=A0A8T1CHX1_9STRA|nr:hypothetical protein PC114_g16293 [Phytophthora cactorum]KAG2923773.1 hypothetical protein PC117_g15630 [Phytophthora cactorum]KAG3004007.1 hypothetical protein PC119_g15749 [Phytophthora cactorum]KAG4049620.1 hypothetical protein PC123_g15125 [Phytophthora cactorum]
MYRINVFDEMGFTAASERVVHLTQRMVPGNDSLHPLEDFHRALVHEAMSFKRLPVSSLALVVRLGVAGVLRREVADEVGVARSRRLLAGELTVATVCEDEA